MDRYLFRGLRIDGKGWVFGYYFENPHAEITLIARWEEQKNGNSYIVDYEVIPETVGQWTGLRDKWEQMIFEGDIIISEIEEVSGVIKYFVDDVRYSLETPEENGLYDLDARYVYEIIGNIHQEGKQ